MHLKSCGDCCDKRYQITAFARGAHRAFAVAVKKVLEYQRESEYVCVGAFVCITLLLPL